MVSVAVAGGGTWTWRTTQEPLVVAAVAYDLFFWHPMNCEKAKVDAKRSSMSRTRDTGSKVALSSAIESAQRADTLGLFDSIRGSRSLYGGGWNRGGFGGGGNGPRGGGGSPHAAGEHPDARGLAAFVKERAAFL